MLAEREISEEWLAAKSGGGKRAFSLGGFFKEAYLAECPVAPSSRRMGGPWEHSRTCGPGEDRGDSPSI